jgi:cellulose synthase/poly-beta-1,6-N-acetylglucosamine synthase-like glycosyltransferase
VRFQEVEYLRAAFNSRFALAPLNGIMCISGACALWKKSVLVNAGGYASNMVWEDAEMTVRVHHYLRSSKTPYRIAFVPEGVCLTRVPETLGDLRRQRMSWQRHITETVATHRNMLFRPGMGLAGWFALPAYVLGEWLAPLWLLLGLIFAVTTAVLGVISWQAQLALLAVVFALTVLKTAMAIVLDELAYSELRLRNVWTLFAAAMLEQFGFRQLLALWGLAGMISFYLKLPIRGRRHVIGPFEPPYRPVMRRRIRAH